MRRRRAESRTPFILDSAEKPPSIRNLEGRCLQRLEASQTPPGAASDSPPFAIRPLTSAFFLLPSAFLELS
jgi:hypothetical protein